MAKQKASKQKKMNVRVDFTPMVDMMMLLITFFMLCTTLQKPQAMQLTMPSNDKNVQEQDRNEAKASQTMTFYLAGNDKLYYVEGITKYDDPTCLKETTYGEGGIRKLLLEHKTEDESQPVWWIRKAMETLEKEKKDKPEVPDSVWEQKLSEIKKGNISVVEIKDLPASVKVPTKVPTMTIIIKPLDVATYDNMVTVLDEMQISGINTYVIDKVSEDDQKLLTAKGIKYE